MANKQREDLIDVFTRWLDTNPSKGLNPIQCATIAQDYANQRVIEELERLKASASGTPEHRVVWEWDLDDRIKELKQD